MASRQCAMTPGHLDIIVSGRMISAGKPLYKGGQAPQRHVEMIRATYNAM